MLMQKKLLAAVAIACHAGLVLGAGIGREKIRLFLLPHTHADVGWLEVRALLFCINI